MGLATAPGKRAYAAANRRNGTSITPMDGYLWETLPTSEYLHPPLRSLVMGDLSARSVAKVSGFGIVCEAEGKRLQRGQAIHAIGNRRLSMLIAPQCRRASRSHLRP